MRVKQLMGFCCSRRCFFCSTVLGAQRGVEAVDLGSALSARAQLGLLDERQFLHADRFARARARRARAHARCSSSAAAFISSAKNSAAAKLATADPRSHGDWQPFTPERLQTELAQGHTVFVDFTAAWCITCKFNEATVLESAAVREAFKRTAS